MIEVSREILSSEKNDLKITRALVSVYDKTGLAEFGAALKKHGVEVVATGGTQSSLEKSGVATVAWTRWGTFQRCWTAG